MISMSYRVDINFYNNHHHKYLPILINIANNPALTVFRRNLEPDLLGLSILLFL